MGKEIWKAGNMLYPLPAVMVSCKRKDEKPNIITVAWAGTVCSDPVMVSISVRPERYSYNIIKETGEFVINLVNKPLTYATDYCGVKSGRSVDKFKEMKLSPYYLGVGDIKGGGYDMAEDASFNAPGVAESPLMLFCKVKEIIPLGSHGMFLAEVKHVVVDDAYMDDKGKFHLNDSDLITYSHGEYYTLGEYVGKFGYSVKKK